MRTAFFICLPGIVQEPKELPANADSYFYLIQGECAGTKKAARHADSFFLFAPDEITSSESSCS